VVLGMFRDKYHVYPKVNFEEVLRRQVQMKKICANFAKFTLQVKSA